MMLKVAVVLIISALTVGVLDVQGAKLTEVVRKSVSVKSPPRDTSVINHFNPAGHVYAAEGNVVINKEPPKPVEVKKAPVVKPEPKRISLAKKVSVHSPITSHSESRHFDPATHNYEATGEVRINRESSLLKQQYVFQANLSPIANKIPREEKLSSKSVSVKSRQLQPSVISHFNPVVHNFEATGSSAIKQRRITKRNASLKSPAPIQESARTRYSYPEPTIKFTEGSSKPKVEVVSLQEISGYLPPKPEVRKANVPKRISSDFTLKKSVSVKSPERKINVINHFNPAAHKYAAEGGVVIDRHSSAEIKSPKVSLPKPAVNIARVKSPSPKPSVKYVAPQPQKSSLSVHKAVSVKSPQRTSSVISHFNPAGHVYAASGEVNIEKHSTRTSSQTVSKKTTPKPAKSVVSYVAPAAKPAPRKPEVAYVAPKRSSSDFTLQKKVSVKSPERKSSVISHFTPAGHKYAAEGGVVIERHSSAEVRSQKVSLPKPAAKTFKSKSTPSPKPTVQYVAPQPQKSSLSVHKAVSVKSPQRTSSVISHFNPAGHVYAASGEVNIEQQSTRTSSQKVSKKAAPKPAKPVVSYVAPVVKPALKKPEVAYVTPKRASSDFTLQKKVSVKSPERKSSVISHFTPAGHKYAAEGGVVIERHSSAEVRSQKVSLPKPAAKTFKSKSTPSPKPTVQYVAPQPQKSSLSVHKAVSVKSPQRTSSVISHFNPAGHVYAASGEVNIEQQSTRTSSQKVVKKTAPKPAKPVVSYVAPVVKPAPSKPKVAYVAPKRVSSDFTLKKRVSVKSPERKSSVISHFTPAGHKYAAEGGVVIDKHSSAEVGSPKISLPKPAAKIIKVKSSPSPKPSVQNVASQNQKPQSQRKSHLESSRSQPKQTTKGYRYPEPKIKFSDGLSKPKSLPSPSKEIREYLPPTPKFKKPEAPRKELTDFSLKKHVSVKSPERKSNVISHFTPATHKYDAEGGVVINRHSSAEVGTPRVSLPKPKTKTVKVKSTPSPKPTVQYVAPQPQKSSLSVHKAVSVKSPQRTSSIISHFNPASHVYAASGEVNIEKQSTRASSQKVAKKTDPKPTRPEVSYVSSAAKPAPRKPEVAYVAPKRVSSDFTLQKKVSVKSPERKSSVISHFTPATHKYAAEGGVVIDRHSSAEVGNQRVSIPKPAVKIVKVKSSPSPKPSVQYVAPRPQKSSLSVHKAVSVKSPQRTSSVISHFNPAGHVYAASEEVNIEQSTKIFSQKVAKKTAPKPAKPVVSYVAPVAKPEVSYVTPKRVSSDFKLQKTVSVKSPERKSSVISHFTPAVHKYAATGGVVIDRHSSAEVGSLKVSLPIPTAKPFKAKSTPSPKPTVQYVAPEPQKSSLSVHKAVSVKSPQRVSSVISHFNPAGHVYAASEEVNIEQSTRISSQNLAKKTSFKPAKPVVSYVAPAVKPAPRKPEVSFAAPKRVSSGFKLQKTVSVKSPERKSSVISHFTPATHKYAAEGGVVIDRHSSAEIGSPKVSLPKPAAKIVKVKSSPSPKPSVQYVAPRPQKSSLSVHKAVSVKSPQRTSSVISHFNPAGHVYAASEEVNIEQSTRISSQNLAKKTLPKPVVTYVAPAPKPEVSYVAPKRVSSDFTLQKRVSVKSPERKSSVISHFTPATHKYAAEGGVVIDRHSSAEIRTPKVSLPKPAAKIVKVKSSPSPKPSVQYVAPQPQISSLSVHKAVSVKSPQRATSVISHFNPAGHVYAASEEVNIEQQSTRTPSRKVAKVSHVIPAAKPAPSKPKVAYVAPKRVSSDFTLQKTVSVKSPERKSSVISHFTPAIHKYAATGGVVIDRHSSAEVGLQRVSLPKPSTKIVKVKSSPSPKPTTQFKVQQQQKSALNVHKAVSVKSPQRASSVVSHFNPAGHVYAASGEVNIERSSVKNLNNYTPKKTSQSSTVSYKAPEVIKPDLSYLPPKYDSDSEVSLKKSVSVKSPERKSTIISHFQPVIHEYETSGNVEINRKSIVTKKLKQKPTSEQKETDEEQEKAEVKIPVKFTLPIQTFTIPVPKGVDLAEEDHENNSSGSSEEEEEEEEEEEVEKEETEQTKEESEILSKFSGIASYLPPLPVQQPKKEINLRKRVSVKSPEDTSTVINHFKPAKHAYETTGGVTISRSL